MVRLKADWKQSESGRAARLTGAVELIFDEGSAQ